MPTWIVGVCSPGLEGSLIALIPALPILSTVIDVGLHRCVAYQHSQSLKYT